MPSGSEHKAVGDLTRWLVSGGSGPFPQLTAALGFANKLRWHPTRGDRMYFEIVTAAGGYRANIKGNNHELMFQTETYQSKASAQNAIEVVKTGAARAPVQDET